MCISLPLWHIFLILIFNLDEKMKSTRFLAHANAKSERMWELYFNYMKFTFAMGIIATTLSLCISWLSNNYDNLYRPAKIESVFCFYLTLPNWLCFIRKLNWEHFSCSFPWNQNTPLGYIGEALFFNIGGQAYAIVNGVFLILFISMCFYHRTFYDMIYHSIDKWNHQIKNHCPDDILRRLIRFHISIKE